jgi:metal-responsive CopG/Arc/MetJ family transcriptional regulator
MNKRIKRSYVLGVRANIEFLDKFDDLCLRLGYNRSEVIRYCLNKFFNQNLNNPKVFQQTKSELC